VKRLVLAGGLVAAVALAVVPAADAALVFSRFSMGDMWVWIANDNGSGAHKLANNGSNPLITSTVRQCSSRPRARTAPT
jgi:hypothetical protein